MDNNYTEIERYLQQEMNEAEKQAFENRLATDKDLLKEFTVQEQITRAAINTGIRNEFGKALRKKILIRKLIRIGIVAAVMAAGVLVYMVKNDFFHEKNNRGAIPTEKQPEQFSINNTADTIIETKDGIVFAIPAHAFNTSDKNVELEIKTALDAYSIMQQGLSTTSNGTLLQTAGMFYINGKADGQPVSLAKDIAVSVPAKEVNPAMQLFEGVEDANGRINWVNPKPIEKKLRTYDITTLDFYPADYIPTLKALKKNYRNKKYTDSLYYSYSWYPHVFDVTSAEDSADAGTVEEMSRGYFTPDTTKKYFPNYLNLEEALGVNDTNGYGSFEINPGRIQAIWDQQFNKTIIATREFEERLRYMHTLCAGKYLDVYLHNLDMPLHTSDRICASKSEGAVKEKFLAFAARKDGGVLMAEGMQQKLSTYFQQKYTAYKDAAAKTWIKFEAEQQRLNAIADNKLQQQAINDFIREDKNFNDEFCINLTNAYSQIGVKKSCADTMAPPARQYYNFTISNTGWKNLDVYVFEATRDRQSMTYTDPATGKIATLTYRELAIQIENQSQYDKVLVYLIPDSLSSFQRVDRQGDVYSEKLNILFRYDAIVLAYKGTAAFYYRQQSIQPGAYTFRLSPVSDEALRKSVNKYSADHTKALQSEFDYQLFEQQENIRQIQLQKELQFREQVAKAIFKCMREGPTTTPAATQAK